MANRQRWTKSETYFVQKNHKLLTIDELAQKLDRTYSSVAHYLSRARLTKPTKPKWSKEELNIIQENYGNISLENILLKLPNRTAKGVMYACLEYNIKSSHELHLKYKHNNKFFSDINSLTSVYWAGFIAGDGHIAQRGKNYYYLDLSLSTKDLKWLQKFVKDINFNGPIHHYSRCHSIYGYPEKIYYRSAIRINRAKEIITDLTNNFNIKPINNVKTYTLEPPINLSFIHNMVYCIGLVDSDGSISICNSKGYKYMHMSFLGTKLLLEWIRQILYQIIPHGNKVTNRGNICQLSINGNNAYKILKTLQKIDCPHMPRKWDKINEYEQYLLSKNRPLLEV